MKKTENQTKKQYDVNKSIGIGAVVALGIIGAFKFITITIKKNVG